MVNLKERNQWLDLTRTLAVLLVVVSHGLTFIPGDGILLAQRMAGFFGVEIFFCLRCFLIGGILINTVKGFDGSLAKIPTFMARRWFRTIPNYYFYLALNLFLCWLGWSFAKESEVGRYLIFTQNLLTVHPPFFPEAWSLAIEEIFYFLLPITFVLAWTALRKPIVAFLVALCALLVLSMALRFHGALHATHWDDEIRKVALYRLDSLMWGVLLAYMHSIALRSRPLALRLLGFALLCFLPVAVGTTALGMAWLDTHFFGKFWLFTITSLGVCGMLSLGLQLRLPRFVKLPTAAIAKWSYSMYLSNLSVLYVLLHYFDRGDTLEQQLARLAGFMALVLLISIATYNIVEKPCLRLRDRILPEDGGQDPMQFEKNWHAAQSKKAA